MTTREESAAQYVTTGSVAAANAATATGEKEWLRGLLSKTTGYRLLVSGEVGPREIGKLIKLLEAQKMVLEDDIAEACGEACAAAATERAAKVCEALPSSYYEDDPMICAAAIRGTT